MKLLCLKLTSTLTYPTSLRLKTPTKDIPPTFFDRLTNAQTETQNLLLANDRLIDELTEDRDKLRASLEEISARVEGRVEADEGLLGDLKSEIKAYKVIPLHFSLIISPHGFILNRDIHRGD